MFFAVEKDGLTLDADLAVDGMGWGDTQMAQIASE